MTAGTETVPADSADVTGDRGLKCTKFMCIEPRCQRLYFFLLTRNGFERTPAV
jgi:hypothetical protein